MYSTANLTSLQPLLFDFSECRMLFAMDPTKRELDFIRYWNQIVSMVPSSFGEKGGRRTGRKGFRLLDILAVRLVMAVYRCGTVGNALEVLSSSANIRLATGMEGIPSPSVVSRRSRELCGAVDFQRIQEELAGSFFEGRIVCNASMDSTPVDARETPEKKTKGDSEAKRKELDILQKKVLEDGVMEQFLSVAGERCSKMGKMNSKGHVQWRIGYKVHLLVDDDGIPIAHQVTGASVHDSRMAFPLLARGRERATILYSLMDSGYCSDQIEDFAKALGYVPVIDSKVKFHRPKQEMEPAKVVRYRARTTVERSNSELKACFLPQTLYSRGCCAVFDLNLSVLLLTLKRMAMVLEKRACTA